MRRSNLSRREFLAFAPATIAAGQRPKPGRVNTVTGPVDAGKLGRTLMHEHIIIDFVGADGLKPGRYNQDEAFAVARPFLDEAHEAGCQTMVEATPEHLGRDAVLLRRLSEATGVHIITSTGIYGARNEQYIPKYARIETAEQLAVRFQAEAEHGIGSTGIRAGVIKCSVNGEGAEPLSEIERKLVRATALAHVSTGLVAECHTLRGHAAIEQLDIFATAKAPPRAFIWAHAHREKDHSYHLKVARAGAWVQFDGIRGPLQPDGEYTTLDWNVECLRVMKEAHLLERVLISHDTGWYQVGDPAPEYRRFGPKFPYQGYTLIFREFLPRLKAEGFTGDEIDQVLIHNPAHALAGL
jgi:predicted metal-dependent phosphotriesterase family hydrolase